MERFISKHHMEFANFYADFSAKGCLEHLDRTLKFDR